MLAVREGLGHVDVLADDVEQAAEPVARLGQPRVGLLAMRDVGDDAADQHAAVRAALRARAVQDHPGHAVDAEHPVGDLGILAPQKGVVEPRVQVPVLGMNARPSGGP